MTNAYSHATDALSYRKPYPGVKETDSVRWIYWRTCYGMVENTMLINVPIRSLPLRPMPWFHSIAYERTSRVEIKAEGLCVILFDYYDWPWRIVV